MARHVPGPPVVRRLVLLLGAGLGLWVGCAGSGVSPEELGRWVGRPAASLEKAWGPATREVSDDGLRLLVYEELEAKRGINTQGGGTGTKTMQQNINAQTQANAHPPQSYVRSYLFWVDGTGKIVRTDVRAGR